MSGPPRGAPPESPTFSIHDLAAALGVPYTTVRWWVRRGVLPPPVGARTGRGARYTAVHYRRGLAVLDARGKRATLADLAERYE